MFENHEKQNKLISIQSIRNQNHNIPDDFKWNFKKSWFQVIFLAILPSTEYKCIVLPVKALET